MKKTIISGVISVLMATSLFGNDIKEPTKEVLSTETVKGVLFKDFGIVIEPGSKLEKDIKNVLIKHKKMKEVTELEPITVTAKALPKVALNTCKGCHGQNWEKTALGKSKIVKDLSEEEILSSLRGYKDGSYGGPMKGVMLGQVSKYSDLELESIAAQIKE